MKFKVGEYMIWFDDHTPLGEPQAWIYLKDGTSIEITHEESGLALEDQYFSARHHCSEDDFENNVYHSTMGVIDQRSGSFADIANMIERLIREIGVKEEPDTPETDDIDWSVVGPRAVFSLISMLYEKKLYLGLDENSADRESDEEACEMTGLTLKQLGDLYDSAGLI